MIGGDMNVRGGTFSPGGPAPAPPRWPMRPQEPSQTGSAFGRAPQAISDEAVQNVTNNQLARSAGAGMSALQGMDRAGVSRGKGQRSRADMAQAMADVGAQGQAARTQMGAASMNAKAQQDWENMRRQEQLGTQGLLEGLRSQRARERMSGMGFAQNIYEALANGQMNLNSIQLDYSPFLSSLMG